MNPDVALVKESYGRCLMSGDLFGRFYDIFLASSSFIAPRFAQTDFNKQKGLLRQGLNLALMFADDQAMGKSGIDRIRSSHAKTGLNIPPNLYPNWLNSFLKAIGELDPQITPQIDAAWRRVLQKAIDHIAGGYNEGTQSARIGA